MAEIMKDMVEKTSQWTDADREIAVPAPAGITIPPWIPSFAPNTIITHDGWEAVVRHVGQEEGHWLVLLEPVRQVAQRNRAAYKRLKHQLGKKKARAAIKRTEEILNVNRAIDT